MNKVAKGGSEASSFLLIKIVLLHKIKVEILVILDKGLDRYSGIITDKKTYCKKTVKKI